MKKISANLMQNTKLEEMITSKKKSPSVISMQRNAPASKKRVVNADKLAEKPVLESSEGTQASRRRLESRRD
jgi:hypothetical protein